MRRRGSAVIRRDGGAGRGLGRLSAVARAYRRGVAQSPIAGKLDDVLALRDLIESHLAELLANRDATDDEISQCFVAHAC
jgi:hypothetical protein